MLAVASIGIFMIPLDATIVAVALPAMGPPLQLSYTQALWIQAAYLLVSSVLLIPAGRLADSLGLMRFYIVGTVIFGLASGGAALASNGSLLIVARCVQGVGGAFIFATSAAVVTAVFPPWQRGRAFGLNIMAAYVGLTLGPLVGGLIVSHASWRWIFLINLPIAILTLALGWRLMQAERRARHPVAGAHSDLPGTRGDLPGLRGDLPGAGIDFPGTGLLAATLVALFIPLTFSPFWGWASARTIGFLVLAVAFLIGFVLVEDRVRYPLFDLNLVRKNRVFVAANSASFLDYVAVFAVTTLTAVFLEVVQGRSAQQAGLIMLGQPVVMAVLSPFTGRLSDRVGSRLLASVGMAVVAAGIIQLALLPTNMGRVLVALGTIGLGMALFSAPNISAVMGSVPRSQLSVASAFLATTRFAGQGVSIAVLGAIAASQLGPEGGRMILLGEATGRASTTAFATGFRAAMFVGAGLALVGALLSLRARGPKGG
ncbi:MAG: MFS transporter [Actinobacteria bacterium]|nr:MFS transporter [Actinomycetota bacterium]